MLLSSGDNFPHLIQKRRSQLGFVTYLLNYPRIFYNRIYVQDVDFGITYGLKCTCLSHKYFRAFHSAAVNGPCQKGPLLGKCYNEITAILEVL